MFLVIVLTLLVVLIGLHYAGFFTYRPSDLPPFADIAFAIEPSVLKEAKRDYNKVIDTVFAVLNSQTALIDNNVSDLAPGAQHPLMAAIEEELNPIMDRISKKYTAEVKARLLKYFVLKHIRVILDNFYIGPHIYFAVPDLPAFNIKAFPFVYDAKRRPGMKPKKASTIAPFKYFAKNIPDKIKPQISSLYDNIVKKYMRAVNKVVSELPEVNFKTIQTIDMAKQLKRYGPMIAKDFETIQKLFGANVSRTIKSILVHNFLPLLNNFYKGPAINYVLPITIPSDPQLVLINFPNTNKENIIKVVPGCPKGLVLQTTVIDKIQGIVVNECILPTTKDLSKLSTRKLECPPGQSLQTTLVDSKRNIRLYECVVPNKVVKPQASSLPVVNLNQIANQVSTKFSNGSMALRAPTMTFPQTVTTPVLSSSPIYKAPVLASKPSLPSIAKAISSPARPLTTTFTASSTASSPSSSSSSSAISRK